MERARKATSRVTYSLREDIAQELVLAYLSGRITLEEMDARASALVHKHLSATEAAKTVSLDAAIYEGSFVTLADRLTEESVARNRLMIYYGSGKGFVSLASCVECRAPLYKVGRTSASKQRYRCLSCGFHATQAVSRSRYFDDETQLAIFQRLRDGGSIRDVARAVGVSNNTVLRYRKLLNADEIAKCGCGKQGGHAGWCWYRLRQKPQRPNFMREARRSGSER